MAALGASIKVRPPREGAGQRLLELTRRVLRCSGAIISLVDEEEHRPFVAAASGLPPDLTTWWGRTPLSISLAQPAGSDDEPLAIEDLREHPLLAADEAIRELGIVSFMGCPLLHEPDGSLGSLVVVHDERRAWSDEDVRNLRDLASMVVTEVELRGFSRRQEDTRRETAERTAAETRQGFSELVHGLDAIVNERDPSAHASFTFVSRSAEELLGYPVRRWLEEADFWEHTLLHPDDREQAVGTLAEALDEGRDVDHEYRVRRADGAILWIRDLVKVLTDDAGRSRLTRGVMVDVTRQKTAHREAERTARALRLLQEVAAQANDADRIDEPLAFAVRRMCAHTGWAAGHAYLVSTGDGELLPTSIWCLSDSERFRPFLRLTEETRFRAGEGLPGRVLETARPEWMEDLTRDGNFPRLRAARACGLAGGFAFPVLAGKEVAAVLEFFFEEPAPPDADLLDLSGHLGTLLGRVVERTRAEAERRASESRLRRTVETANEAFVSIDEEGMIREWNAQAAATFGWERKEVHGRRLSELILPPELRDRHEEGLRRFRETGDGPVLNRRIELPALTRDGRRIPVEITISPLREGSRWVFNAFLHDITDRKVQEEEQEKRQRQLQEAQRIAGIGSWEWDPETGELEWTEELYRIFGLDPREGRVTYEAYRDRIHPEDAGELEQAIQEAVRSGTPYALEHRIVRPDGEVRVVHARGQVATEEGEEGEVVRLIGTAQDITERKELERQGRRLGREQAARSEAEAARERIRGILESITDAFFAVDTEWRITHLNSAGSRLLSADPDSLVGEVLWDAAPELGGTALEETLRRSLGEGEPLEVEELLDPLGGWFEVRAYPTGDGLSVYFHDIDHRKRVEGELRASESRYRFLADAIPQQIWTAQPDGELGYVNRVVTEYFGLEAEALIGGGFEDFVHPDDRAEYVEGWSRARGDGEPFEAELRIRRHDGEHRWHLLRALAQCEDDGRISRWFGSTTDVHDRKEAEQERDRALEDLERINYVLESDRGHLERQARELRRTARALSRSNEELDQFAYVASHDLKAPLRGIANLAAWLEEDLGSRLGGETREYLDLLQGRVQRMESLINGILQYSRAGRTGEEPVDVDVRALVEEVIDMVSPPEGVEVRIDPHLPVLRSPRAPLEQVFLNLVSNAVKHADEAEPVVSVRVSDEGADLVEFSVSDNGRGIDPAYHEKIFTIFQTLRPADEEEGTGIGLAVVEKLVERYGGDVWVESEEGAGATFRFLWPRAVVEEE